MQTLSLDSIKHLAPRVKSGAKWDYGHVGVIAGDQGMSGAAAMASYAALVSGAGLVSLYTHEAHSSTVTSDHPEIMTHSVCDAKALTQNLSRATVLAVGPGMGMSEWSEKMTSAVFRSKLPKVIDAGALSFLSTAEQCQQSVITPHEREAARLLGVAQEVVSSDRQGAVQLLAKKFQCGVVLKGADTLMCFGRDVALCPYGTPKMATAGMGDILSGIIAGLVAQGLSLKESTYLGVLAHARAGELAFEKIKSPSILATELLMFVRSQLI